MKKWTTPAVEKIDIQATEYSVSGGTRVDGAYTSQDGKYNYPTYGPSGGNDGIPSKISNDPTTGNPVSVN